MNAGTTLSAASYVLCSTLLGASAVGCCMPAHAAAMAPAVCPTPEKRADDVPSHVYRLDFVVTTGEGAAPGTKEQFTMNVAERQHGSVSVGRNVPLQVSVGSGAVSPRQDVGLKLVAECRASGDDALVQLSLEVSDTESVPAGSAVPIHKATATGDVLAKLGQPALALHMDDGHKQYDVSVTVTRLR